MIERLLYPSIKSRMYKGKILVLLGPRQTGETTLLTRLADETGDYFFLDGDDPAVRQLLHSPNT